MTLICVRSIDVLLLHVHDWVHVFCYWYTFTALCEDGSMCIAFTCV
jgi:hypothetical protein